MKFRGTKGNWELDSLHPLMVYCDDILGSAVADCRVPLAIALEPSERNYNALLISKAPDMLEMLTNVKDYLASDVRDKVEQLIKEATELQSMEKFKNGDLVVKSKDGKSIILIVTWGNGDNKNTFKGTVLKSDFDFYKIGEHSGTWHESKFELAPKDTTVTINQQR